MNVQLSCPPRPPVAAGDVEKTRQPGHQSERQSQETPLPRPRLLERRFRLRGGFDLRRGQVVELVFDEDPPISERCSVVWVGKAGSKKEREVGLESR